MQWILVSAALKKHNKFLLTLSVVLSILLDNESQAIEIFRMRFPIK